RRHSQASGPAAATLDEGKLDVPGSERLERACGQLLLDLARHGITRQRIQLACIARGDEHAEVLAARMLGQLAGCEHSHQSFSSMMSSISDLSSSSSASSSGLRATRSRSAATIASIVRSASSKSSLTMT